MNRLFTFFLCFLFVPFLSLGQSTTTFYTFPETSVLVGEASEEWTTEVSPTEAGTIVIQNDKRFFLPNVGFKGVVKMGNLEVIVHNFEPKYAQYYFTATKNKPLTLHYPVPTKGATWVLRKAAHNGTIIYEQVRQSIVYSPNPETLRDTFEWAYCTPYDCKNVQFIIHLSEKSPTSEGDINHDGEVNATDYIAVAQKLGSSSSEEISADTTAIRENWGNTYSLIASNWLPKSDDLRLEIVPTNSDSVYLGEKLELDVILMGQPKEGLQGIGFELQYPNKRLKSGLLEYEWKSEEQPTDYLTWQQNDLKNGSLTTVYGTKNILELYVGLEKKIGKLGIVITDDLAGFQSGAGKNLSLRLEDVLAVDKNGKNEYLKSVGFQIPIAKAKRNQAPIGKNIVAYPNPVNDIINVQTTQSSNGNNILQMRLRDPLGKVIHSEKGKSVININNLNNGMYILEVETEFGWSSTKIVKR